MNKPRVDIVNLIVPPKPGDDITGWLGRQANQLSIDVDEVLSDLIDGTPGRQQSGADLEVWGINRLGEQR